MTAGDTIAGFVIPATSGYMDLQTSTATQEWIVHNIYHEGDTELFRNTNLTSSQFRFDIQLSGGAWVGMFFHNTNTNFIRARNIQASGKMLAFDGVISKE